jgi:Protein of unknown function (DUF3017)
VLNRVLHWVVDQLAFLAVLLLIAAAFGYLIAEPDRWRPGTAVISAGVLLAGLLRLMLPVDRVGLLAVRSRWLDAACFLVLGGLILAVDIRLHT